MTTETDLQNVIVYIQRKAEEDQTWIPALIFDVPYSRHCRHQYIHRNQERQMLGEPTAKWSARWINGQWSIADRLPW